MRGRGVGGSPKNRAAGAPLRLEGKKALSLAKGGAREGHITKSIGTRGHVLGGGSGFGPNKQ